MFVASSPAEKLSLLMTVVWEDHWKRFPLVNYLPSASSQPFSELNKESKAAVQAFLKNIICEMLLLPNKLHYAC